MTTPAISAPSVPTTVGMVPLGRLRFGHDAPNGSINIRVSDRDKGLDTLQAAIRSEGFIQSVLACELPGAKKGDPLYVAAGNRRLAALFGMLENGEITSSYEVPAITKHGITPAEARRASLAENMERLPLHPVDRHEAFVILRDDGASAEEIAARFAVTSKQVQQDLALGSLSPKIREEWRAERINAEAARAFTLAGTHKDQDKLHDKLRKQRNVSAWSIKHELKVTDRDVGSLLAFVTADAYRAAGGKVTEDLFGTSHVISDGALLKRLADEKVAAVCERLIKEEGWSWALPSSQIEREWQYGRSGGGAPTSNPTKDEKKRLDEIEKRTTALEGADGSDLTEAESDELEDLREEQERIEAAIRGRAYSDRQKAKAGCIVSIDGTGALSIDYGRIKPAQEKSAVARAAGLDVGAAQKKPKPKAGAVSNALMCRLSETLTWATVDALKVQPKVALPAILAGFATHQGVKVSERGLKTRQGSGHTSGSFANSFAMMQALTQERQLEKLAEIAGAAIDFQVHHANNAPLKQPFAAALCGALPGINAELRKHFDAKDYFGSVNKAMCLKAIAEAVNADEARKIGGKPKADVTKFAIANVPKTGWLPPELRTTHYDGPGAEKAEASPKGKQAKGKKR